MKTVIIGGGKGCRSIINLASGQFLRELTMNIVCVVDPDPEAPGIVLAKSMGVRTSTDMKEALALEGVELVIELTGQDKVLEQIYKLLPHGSRIIDHTFAHIFWDLVNAQREREQRLKDVTALEKKVESERWFLQSLVDTIPDLVVVLSGDKRVIRSNLGFRRFTGKSSEKIAGTLCDTLFAGTELEAACPDMTAMMDMVLETGQPRHLIWQTATPNEAYWEVSYTPILDENLEINAIVGSWHRITETVMLHREIESAEQRFKSFINSAHDWISIKDTEGRYVIVNPACAEAFHMRQEDFVGRTVGEVLDPELSQMIQRHDTEVQDNRRHITYDEVFLIDGRERHFQTVRFPLTDYKQSVIGVCTIARDVTEEMELRDQLVQAAKLAAVGKLAAGVAHEINNPLTGVLAYAEDIIEDLPEDSTLREDMEVIIRETMRCRDIVRNLLDFSRADKPDLTKVTLNLVVENSLMLVHKLPQFRNISITTDLQKDLPRVECDIHQLQQVVLNLMMNAAEAMSDNGRIIIRTIHDRSHGRCVIEVEDNGPGIPANMVDKIFEPFYSTKGTNGLGLAVSWGIVERHKGSIEVDEAPGGGAIFRVILPAVAMF